MSLDYIGRDFRDESFASYARALGELALAWNDLHHTLGELFWQMLRIPNGMIPYAVWHSAKSDRAQRDMIKSLAHLNAMGHDVPQHLRTEITWILGRIDTLEDMRNDVLHSPMFNSGDAILPAHELGHQRAKKLAGKDLLFELTWFYDTAITLRDYAVQISSHLRRPSGLSGALPERPQLPNRGDAGARKQRRQE